jgi:hypothetical protein
VGNSWTVRFPSAPADSQPAKLHSQRLHTPSPHRQRRTIRGFLRGAQAQARVRCSDVAFRGYIAELPPGTGPAAFAAPAAPTHVLDIVHSDSEGLWSNHLY